MGDTVVLLNELDVVLADSDFFDDYLEDAHRQYRMGYDSVGTGSLHRPNSFGLLGGTIDGDAMVLKQFAFARNVRAVDPVPLQEFEETIVPQFGPQYDDGQRGFWCDSRDLLRVARDFEAEGLELLGSIHLHPDWHRIGPAHERGTQKLSEQPSRMDEYLFRSAGWPLNIICYLESRAGGIAHTYGAYRAPEPGEPLDAVVALKMRFF
jgi:hypothetical protein